MAGAAPLLYLVTDRHATAGRRLTEVVRAALAGLPAEARQPGAVALQLREKELEGGALARLAHQLRAVTAEAGVALFVNDRVDVALAVGADGVHLGRRGLSPAAVAGMAPGLAVAVSTHERAEVERAAQAPNVRFAVFGPVFDTPSKRAYGLPVGLDALRSAAAAGLPVLALGGVTPERTAACLTAGATGVACIRAVWGAPDPGQGVFAFWAALNAPRPVARGRT